MCNEDYKNFIMIMLREIEDNRGLRVIYLLTQKYFLKQKGE